MTTSKTPTGDCFRAAAEMVVFRRYPAVFVSMLLSSTEPLYLVHGLVRDASGHRHAHAWAECGDLVFDLSNGNQAVVRKTHYYAMGQIGKRQRVQYSISEAQEMLSVHEHFGPWPGAARDKASSSRKQRAAA